MAWPPSSRPDTRAPAGWCSRRPGPPARRPGTRAANSEGVCSSGERLQHSVGGQVAKAAVVEGDTAGVGAPVEEVGIGLGDAGEAPVLPGAAGPRVARAGVTE